MTEYWDLPQVYAVKHKDLSIRMNSRSGGFFTALSDYVLDHGGVVYGCILTDQFEAVHVRADSREMRDAMRGSKYIQSRMQDTFKDVKLDLEADRTVLFSGTPCQVAGLRNFLQKSYDRLIAVDILCHGVPSEKVWKEYLHWQEKRYGKCTAVDFRNKKEFGWASHVETLNFNGKLIHSRIFTSIFYGHTALRPCCYQCPFRSVNRVGDITMADYWEIERACPGFNDNKGVSLVFINNDKGSKYFESVIDVIEWKQTRLEDSTRPSMLNPFQKPGDRDSFWKDLYSNDFSYVARKYGGYDMKSRMRNTAGRMKSRLQRH